MSIQHPLHWRSAPAPHPLLQACVVLPVRNEQARLLQSLNALKQQCGPTGAPLPAHCFEVLVLVNNSVDDSLQLALCFARENPQLAMHVADVELPPDEANIGHVRRLLMDAAWHRLQDRTSSVRFIASTDSDSRVEPDWLACTLAEFDRGADAVGGRIRIDAAEPVPPSALRLARLDLAYRLAVLKLQDHVDPEPGDPWPCHHQHFCASLAVTPEAYAKVGGLPAVRYLEDEALVAALRACDLRVRHSPAVQVRTSGRAEGRVEVGLSWQLREWARHAGDEAAMPMVDGARRVLARLRLRRRLRKAWLASACDRSFGAWWQQTQSALAAKGRGQVPMRQAVDELRSLIAVDRGPRRRSG